ncbi:MAG: acetolactate synthase large subunit, partial [Pseudomonadota bacterium]
SSIPSLVREAFRRAEEERPGAVLLELPEDIAAETTDEAVFQASNRRYATASAEVIAQAAGAIKAAQRPLLLVGAGANRKHARQALRDFIAHTGMPFFTTQMGKGVIDERNPLCLGTAALSDGDYLHCAIDRADLIVNVGHDVVEKPPFFMQHGGKTVIHINYCSAQVDAVYFPQIEVVGDLQTAVEDLAAELGPLSHDTGYFDRVRAEVESHVLEGTTDDRFPMIPQRVVADLRALMGNTDMVALDNGIYKIWFARNYKAYAPNTVLLDNALATMGAGLPSAMMASLLYPERRVIAVCGDGGFMMNSQELETALRLKLSLVVIVLNDSAYGMIRWKQRAAGMHDWGLAFNNPDFVRYAESYGAVGHRVSAAADLVPTVEAAFERGGVHVIDVPVDYSENQRVLVDELRAKACLL